jgi:hypothetical protein
MLRAEIDKSVVKESSRRGLKHGTGWPFKLIGLKS